MNKLVLMEGETFVVSDEAGQIGQDDPAEGLYHHDTRYLSHFSIRFNGRPVQLLSASGERTFMATVQLTNEPLTVPDGTAVLPQTVGIRRNRYVLGSMQERIHLVNFNRFPVPYELELVLAADFRDMFDVRGYGRHPIRGRILDPSYDGECILFSYRGVDGVERFTEMYITPKPETVWFETPAEAERPRVTPGASLPDATIALIEPVPQPVVAHAVLRGVLHPHAPVTYTLRVQPREGDFARGELFFDEGTRLLRRGYERWERDETASIESSNSVFDRLIQRSKLDLRVLLQRLQNGPIPVAGIPWFATVFGRDSVITALQTLMLAPDVTVGTLRFLAMHQGSRVDDWRDEEPGKIMHEIRYGEMARGGEVPHTPYYGSADSTPLFLILFAEFLHWTNDRTLIESLKPSVMAALEWLDRFGDLDGDGYVEYKSRSSCGIRNQNWKDSFDSVTYPDGKLVEPPIAPVEVQAYVHLAKLLLAEFFAHEGEHALAERLRAEARRLKEQFNRDFWMPEHRTYAQALDAKKQPVRAVTSNAGHALFGRIADEAHAAQLASRLLESDLCSGWGLRTLSSHAVSYNPMSYHNGSIWPHDNALVISGLRAYGLDEAANELSGQIYQAATRFPYMRMPELYCGFTRDPRYEGAPSSYPVSCSPQAWAAGTPIMILQSLLGLRPDARVGRLHLRPAFPDWLKWIQITNLRVGTVRLDLRIERAVRRYRVDVQRGGEAVHVIVES